MALARPLQNDAFNYLNQARTPLVAQWAVAFAVVVTKWAIRRRTRLALAQLEPWQLRDVGLTPEEAHREAHRVFWQV